MELKNCLISSASLGLASLVKVLILLINVFILVKTACKSDNVLLENSSEIRLGDFTVT